MRTRSLIAAALCGVTILGWTFGHGSGPAVAARECPADVGAADHAIGVDAVYQGSLVGTPSSADARQPSSVVARQVATSARPNGIRRGSAGCRRDRRRRRRTDAHLAPDRRGVPPHVVGPRCGGLGRRRQARRAFGVPGERTIAGPQPGGIVFAPVFVGRAIVAAVSAAPTAAVPEDAWSDDLWLLRGGRWHRLTAFAAGTDRWTAIRTPFLAADGSVEFVVVRGPRIAGRAAAVLAVAAARWRGASRHAARR